MADVAETDGAAVEPTYIITVPLEHPDPDSDPATIVMRALDANAWAVFARVHEQLKTVSRMPEGQRVQFALRNVALIMRALQLCIVDENDQVWIDEQIMAGELTAINAMGMVSEVAEQHYATEAAATAPTTGPVRLRR